MYNEICENNSMVEPQFSKLVVVGSNPISRWKAKLLSIVVELWSPKPKAGV